MSAATPAAGRNTSPYKGLDYYEEEDEPFFFGRKSQRELVAANILAAPLTLLYGESGVGKSSLLLAGVVPRLRQEPDVTIVVLRSWDGDPVARLTTAIHAAAGVEPATRQTSLAETIETCTERLGNDLVVILDQFEEFFVYHPQDDAGRAFEAEFSRAVSQRNLRASFLISIREDALAWLDRFEGQIPNLFGNYLRVERLSREEAEDAIVCPLGEYERRFGEGEHMEIEGSLVDAVLDQVRVGSVQFGQAGGGVIGNPGVRESRVESPYLQLVLTRLLDEEKAAHSHVLRLSTLERLGGAKRIVQEHLDSAMATLSDADRELAARVFHFLVTPSGTKIAHQPADLAAYAEAPADDVESLLARLGGQQVRILRSRGDGKYEIYHDVLAAGILDWRARYLQGPRFVATHVVVLMLAGRSFDHLLGYLPHPDPVFDGLLGRGRYTNPARRGPAVAASPSAKTVLPVAPALSHDAVLEQLALNGGKPTNQGFVTSYERRARGEDLPAFGGLLGPMANWAKRSRARSSASVTGRGPLIMACQPPEQVPVLGRLALAFGVCTRWFCSMPGEAWPNRNFAHAATSDGQTEIEIRPYTNRTIFELLENHGADWRIYHDDTPQVWAFPALRDTRERQAKFFPMHQFTEHAARGELPEYTFIEPNHRSPLHTIDHEPLSGSSEVSNSQDPQNNLVSNAAYDMFTPHGTTDFARAEQLIATTYEALRANPELFDRTILLITYDTHGGFYDHVPPPVAVPSPGGPSSHIGRVQRMLLYRKAQAFDFTMLGPRVPAVVISPRVPAGTVDRQVRDHASIPATLRALFAPDATPLTSRDYWAAPFHGLRTLRETRTDLPDLSAYVSRHEGSIR